jgi:hypothetical protein
MTKEAQSTDGEDRLSVGRRFRYLDFVILSDFDIRHSSFSASANNASRFPRARPVYVSV